MELSLNQRGDAAVVTVEEARIDAVAAIRFKDAMRELVPDDAVRVILDLGKVEFIDSSGLGAIVSVMKALGDGRALELAAMQPNVDRVFRLTRMDTVFPIHATVSDAVSDHAS